MLPKQMDDTGLYNQVHLKARLLQTYNMQVTASWSFKDVQVYGLRVHFSETL